MYGGAWRCLAELAALRRDAKVFASAVLSQARFGVIGSACSTWPQVEYRHWAAMFDEICIGFGVEYTRNDKKHRTDGPAVQDCGGITWCYSGVQRRNSWVEQRPAYVKWYFNDTLHRIDGPAVERDDGTKEWWLHGVRYRNSQVFWRHVCKSRKLIA